MQRTSTEDYRQLDDPALLRERARVRAERGHTPASTAGHQKLAALYDQMTAECIRRVAPAAPPSATAA